MYVCMYVYIIWRERERKRKKKIEADRHKKYTTSMSSSEFSSYPNNIFTNWNLV